MYNFITFFRSPNINTDIVNILIAGVGGVIRCIPGVELIGQKQTAALFILV